MSASACPYIGEQWPRQSAIRRGAVAAVLAMVLGGCSAVGVPLGEGRVSSEATGAIPVSALITDRADPSDWEAVRRAVAGVPVDTVTSRVEWSNRATGSSGTIALLHPPTDRGGALCRPLTATVNDVRGVRRYRGDACRSADGVWRLHGMTADDAILL